MNDKTSSRSDLGAATAAARRAFDELPAAARRSRRARFCEPAVPPLTRIIDHSPTLLADSSFVSIAAADDSEDLERPGIFRAEFGSRAVGLPDFELCVGRPLGRA